MDPNACTLIKMGTAFQLDSQKNLRRDILTLLLLVLGGLDPKLYVRVPSKMFHVGDARSHFYLRTG